MCNQLRLNTKPFQIHQIDGTWNITFFCNLKGEYNLKTDREKISHCYPSKVLNRGNLVYHGPPLSTE